MSENDQVFAELDLKLVTAAAEGALLKLNDSRPSEDMVVASSDRHPIFHILTDILGEELTAPMDSVPSGDYRQGVTDALQAVELALSEYDGLRATREHFPEGISIPTDVGDIIL